ncbi:phosphopantetheine-binding protein [Kitasatospora purpeofusca]|uniref:phosphopantetheine-binding protein n=1 Tax=Kitasatospora purpeofusca TaxID=67352 RepID=UPI00340BD18B
MLVDDAVQAAVNTEIRALLEEAGNSGEFDPEAELYALGLSSMMLARLTIALEDSLEIDPASEEVNLTLVRTPLDLAHSYRQVLEARTSQTVSS